MKKETLTYRDLKRMYPIGTRFISPFSMRIFQVGEYFDFPFDDDDIVHKYASVKCQITKKNSIYII